MHTAKEHSMVTKKQTNGFQGTKGKAKREVTFRGSGYVHYLDCGDVFMDILYVKSVRMYQITL